MCHREGTERYYMQSKWKHTVDMMEIIPDLFIYVHEKDDGPQSLQLKTYIITVFDKFLEENNQ